MSHKIGKFENPNRIAELNPADTLLGAGLKANMVLCDIGAGTGIFSFPAASITNDTVYALEISDDMIELLSSRKRERNTHNLVIKKVTSEQLPLDNDSCDMVLMVTVLHEIADKHSLFTEITRILKKAGRLVIIEFHKRETPMGPPVQHRLAQEQTEALCEVGGFIKIESFDLGSNFYGVVFERA